MGLCKIKSTRETNFAQSCAHYCYDGFMAQREINQWNTGGRDRLFYLEYKQFKLIGGGRPAFILAVGAPLTIIAIFAILIGSQDAWTTITIVLTCLLIYAIIAGVWVWKETQRPD